MRQPSIDIARLEYPFEHGSAAASSPLWPFSRRCRPPKIAISMDGKGAWRDNVFVERLWRTIKYEEVYLRAYRSVSEARRSLGRYLAFYNRRRPHSSLGGQTPESSLWQPAQRQSRQRHNQSGDPLINSLQTVQGNRATSVFIRTGIRLGLIRVVSQIIG